MSLVDATVLSMYDCCVIVVDLLLLVRSFNVVVACRDAPVGAVNGYVLFSHFGVSLFHCRLLFCGVSFVWMHKARKIEERAMAFLHP